MPWREETNEDVILKQKLAWSGAALCAGYPPVFAELIDYSRAVGFEEAPDYARWKARLRALIPGGLPDNAVYVLGDRSEPRVGRPRTEPIVMVPEHVGKVIDEFSDVEDEDSLPDSNDHWIPTSSWAEPYSIRDFDLAGDEASIVRAHLEKIDETPGMEYGWLYNGLVEVMAA